MTTSKWCQFNNKNFNLPLFYWSYWENKKNSWFPWTTVAWWLLFLQSLRFTSGTLPMSRKQLFSSTPGIKTIQGLLTVVRKPPKKKHQTTSLVLSKAYWPGQNNRVPCGFGSNGCNRFKNSAIALSTAIRLMTTASSAIASRFTWHNMAQDKVQKNGNNSATGSSRFQDVSGVTQVTPQKTTDETPSAHRKVCYLNAFAFRSPRGPWHL